MHVFTLFKLMYDRKMEGQTDGRTNPLNAACPPTKSLTTGLVFWQFHRFIAPPP